MLCSFGQLARNCWIDASEGEEETPWYLSSVPFRCDVSVIHQSMNRLSYICMHTLPACPDVADQWMISLSVSDLDHLGVSHCGDASESKTSKTKNGSCTVRVGVWRLCWILCPNKQLMRIFWYLSILYMNWCTTMNVMQAVCGKIVSENIMDLNHGTATCCSTKLGSHQQAVVWCYSQRSKLSAITSSLCSDFAGLS